MGESASMCSLSRQFLFFFADDGRQNGIAPSENTPLVGGNNHSDQSGNALPMHVSKCFFFSLALMAS